MARTSSWRYASAAWNASTSIFSAVFASLNRPYAAPSRTRISATSGWYPIARASASTACVAFSTSFQRPASARAFSSASRRRSSATFARVTGSSGGRTTARSSVDVGATVQRRQRVGRADGVLDDLAVRLAEHVGERAQSAQALLQARHAQVQHLGRLLAVDLRRLARLLVHVRPVLRVAGQHAR